jgi:RHS repeat-associated protein
MSRYFSLFLFPIFFINLLETAAYAQVDPPSIIYEVRTDANGADPGPFPAFTVPSGGWDYTIDTTTGNLTRTAKFLGSVNGNQVTLTGTAEQQGVKSPVGVASNTYARYDVKGWVKGPASVTFVATTNATISNSYQSGSSFGDVSFGDIPFGSENISIHIDNSGSGTDSHSGVDIKSPTLTCGTSAPTKTFTQYPGVTYYQFYSDSFASSTYYNAGTVHGLSDGTVSFTATVGATPPTALMAGPLISGQPAGIIPPGATISFTNLSYDPDNEQGTTALTGVCQAKWTITHPDGSVTTSTNLSSINLTAKTGKYTVVLEPTDNEGMTSLTSISFTVGDARTSDPGDNEDPCADDGFAGASGDPSSGNIDLGFPDPVRTRGYPLRNDIHINSQSNQSWVTGPMGNATFSYGIKLLKVPTPSSPTQNHWIVIDGDGKELDFGPTSSPPNASAGIFSKLVATPLGMKLINAAAPGKIEAAGNFSYQFSTLGRLTSLVDPAGNVQKVQYDSSGALARVVDASSNKNISFVYNASGLIERVIANGGNVVTHLAYNSNRLSSVEVKNAQGITTRSAAITYNSLGLPSQVVKDGDLDTALTFTYVDFGHGVYVGNITDTLGGGTKFQFSEIPPSGVTHRTSQLNVKGGTTFYDFDSKGDLLAVTLPPVAGATQTVKFTYAYDVNHKLTSVSDGATSYTLTYTADGFLAQITNSAGDFRKYNYSGLHLFKVEDNIGTLFELSYTNTNLPNLPTLFKDGDGNVWTRTLNSYGQTTSIVPPAGSSQGIMRFRYQDDVTSPAYGYLAAVTNGNGEITTIDGYTSMGDIASITTTPVVGTPVTKTFTYDAAQRMTAEVNGDGSSVQYGYVGKDLTSITDEGGTQNTYEYCPACDKLTAVHESLGRNLSWVLDADKNVTSFIDPLIKQTTYDYGTAGELKQLTYPDNNDIIYRYDNFGRLSWVEVGSSFFRATRTYDISGRISSITYGISSPLPHTYTYYEDGSLKVVGHKVGTTTYTYTPGRRVKTVSYNYSAEGLSNLQLLEYDYYPDGAVKTLSWKNGSVVVATWTYSYDLAGRLLSVTNSFGESAAYSYDAEGKLLIQTNGNGTSTAYQYNQQRSWPTRITQSLSGTPFARYDLAYDGGANTVGNLTDVTELDGTTIDYTYDALYRLTGEARVGTNAFVKGYGYDLSGNLTTLDGSFFATYDSANKIATIAGGSVTYTPQGALAKLSPNALPGSGDWSYAGNLSLQFQVKGSANSEYFTDGEGRRVGASPSSGANKFYIFDGDRIIGEVNSSEVATAAYTWGTDGLVSERLIASNKSLYYHFGPQGETRQLTNSSGVVVDTYLYTAYGVPLVTTGSDANPHRYGGKYGYYFDGYTGILLAGARWYNPYLARWLSRDPIGYEGGTNLYEYANSNPVRWVDPSGLEAEDIFLDVLTNPDVVNFSAGLGDSLLFGFGDDLRDALNIGGVNRCSGAYLLGEATSAIPGVARGIYVAGAKALSLAPGLSGKAASAGRNALRAVARLGVPRKKKYVYADLIRKYGTDEAVKAAAGRTNSTYNALGLASDAAALANEVDRGCGCS